MLIEENNIETTEEGKNVGEEKDKMEGKIDDKWNLKFLVIIYISMNFTVQINIFPNFLFLSVFLCFSCIDSSSRDWFHLELWN